ncbi:MAG TPA: isoprenylcysteine carboxylmethyltransferase family protein [Opitutaceae bacterium]|jgi:protein-S-isoprenylcysteine O-methyltransferase Ste14
MPPCPGILAAAIPSTLVVLVLGRIAILRAKGVRAFKFGAIDRKDFLIPPFALFYLYLCAAPGLGLPVPWKGRLFAPGLADWAGSGFLLAGLVVFFISLLSFGRSFRVGIDKDAPAGLVTTGIFGLSRNPIYVGFGCVLLGEFLVHQGLVFLIYLAAAGALIHRQVLREEAFMRRRYGERFVAYQSHVRRYL